MKFPNDGVRVLLTYEVLRPESREGMLEMCFFPFLGNMYV